MPCFKLTISYEGTRYLGWQRNGDQPTIEYQLLEAFQKISLCPLKFEGASRTDRGVHALGQVAKVELAQEPKDLRLALVGLNSQLPEDIRILKLEKCAGDFHPTLDSTSKTYAYYLSLGPAQAALYRHFRWHIPQPLDLANMQKAATYLIGTHDFESFTNVKKLESYDDHTRTIYRLEISELEAGELKILVQGNHFLYKMVRNLVGWLVEVGKGKRQPQDVVELLAHKDRKAAAMTAPAHGLVLLHISYDLDRLDAISS